MLVICPIVKNELVCSEFKKYPQMNQIQRAETNWMKWKKKKDVGVLVQNDQNENDVIPNPKRSTSSSSSEAGAAAAAASETAATTGATVAGACFNLVFVARLSTFPNEPKKQNA